MQNKEFLARLDHFSSHSEPGYSGHGRNLGRQRFAGATKNTPQRYSFEAPPICTELGFTMFTPKYLLKPRTNKSCSSISKSRCIFFVLLTAVTNDTSAKTASSQSFFSHLHGGLFSRNLWSKKSPSTICNDQWLGLAPSNIAGSLEPSLVNQVWTCHRWQSPPLNGASACLELVGALRCYWLTNSKLHLHNGLNPRIKRISCFSTWMAEKPL